MTQNNQEVRKQNINNFDLIRLFAATKVAIFHMLKCLHTGEDWLAFLSYIPGVPIFFFISGYLIYKSYNNIENKSKNLSIFYTNRFLRLYPGLYVCFLISFVSIYLSGYFDNVGIPSKQFIVWVVTSLTFFQFYNPDFLRGYGMGAINGSLWSIAVELQFYLLAPLVFTILNKSKKMGGVLFVGFIIINVIKNIFFTGGNIFNKLISVSFAPWIYMFIFGAYISKNKAIQEKILSIHPVIFLVTYILTNYIAVTFNLGTSNTVNPISFLILGCLVFKIAYTKPRLSKHILGNNDISYGVYIYHMPIVNFLLFKKFNGTPSGFFIAILLTYIFAYISWTLIERPALNLKKIALRHFN